MKQRLRASRTGKVKTTVYFSSDLVRSIKTICRERGITLQGLVESAVATFVDPQANEDKEVLLARRLNNIENKLRALSQNIEVLAEAHAQFVRLWMFNTVEVPISKEESAIVQARERFKHFISTISKRLEAGEIIYKDLHSKEPGSATNL